MISKESKKLIEAHEGRRNELYYDTENVPTAGIGHNLLKRFSDKIVDLLFEEDLEEVLEDCQKYDWYDQLDPARRAVIENMMFNLGASKFSRFRLTIEYIEDGNFKRAADEMKNSKWYSQVGYRAVQLCDMMRIGEWPD